MIVYTRVLLFFIQIECKSFSPLYLFQRSAFSAGLFSW